MRPRHRGRAAGGRGARRGHRGRGLVARPPPGGELTDPVVVRTAVESALAVARAGLTSEPVIPPPPALRPYLGFAKQTPRSLAAIARVVDRDDAFRARVVEAVDEDEVGRAGWLWLARPEGWEAELDEILARSAARQADEDEARAERSAVKRLAAAQAAAARAEATASSQAAELSELRAALVTERGRRAEAESRASAAERAAAELAESRAAAVRQLKAVEVKLVERSTELNAMKARVRQADAAAPEPPAAPAGPPGPPGSPVPAAAAPGEVPAVAAPAGDDDRPPATEAASGGPVLGDVIAELGRAAEGAALLAEGLAGLARRLGAGAGADTGAGAGADTGAGVGTDTGAGAGTDTGAGAGAAPAPDPGATPAPPVPAPGGGPAPDPPAVAAAGHRVPLDLPGGMFDDSVEAASHLLRAPGTVLVVDGYNVSMTAWPELSAADQRRRLVAGLDDLAARTLTPIEVVFDGAEVDGGWVPSPGRRLVRTRFSSVGVEADDVVIDLVDHLPPTTPVIVASSDKRVREGARRGGANLLHAHQLVALLRR